MSFIDGIIEKDIALFIYLNGLGLDNWDSFWLTVTDKYTWIPMYIILAILLVYFFKWKKALLYLLIAALLVAFTDQFVNLIKNTVGRLRPCNDPNLQDYIRILKHSGGYSFVSGHATNSFAVSTFMILIFKNNFKYIYLIVIWPLLFAYSRIYVGVHFPIDIFIGMLLGLTIGISFYTLSKLIVKNKKTE